MSERWLRVAAVTEIGTAGKLFSYWDGPFEETGILVRVGAEVRAWRNLCRHLAFRLDHDRPGEVMDRGGSHLLCQQHGAIYRLEDGLCTAGPCRGSHLRSLPVHVESGEVLLDTSALGAFFASGGPQA